LLFLKISSEVVRMDVTKKDHPVSASLGSLCCLQPKPTSFYGRHYTTLM
jgi:hypothetical protein